MAIHGYACSAAWIQHKLEFSRKQERSAHSLRPHASMPPLKARCRAVMLWAQKHDWVLRWSESQLPHFLLAICSERQPVALGTPKGGFLCYLFFLWWKSAFMWKKCKTTFSWEACNIVRSIPDCFVMSVKEYAIYLVEMNLLPVTWHRYQVLPIRLS